MNLLISSVVRYSKPEEPTGYIYTVNLEDGNVTKACPVLEPNLWILNKNPRGGMRGARGITVADGRIFIANFSSVRVYDTSWKLINVITHPSCASIHDILINDENLWVTSVRNDLILHFDWSGNILGYFNYREYENILSELDLKVSNLLNREAILSGKIDFRDPRAPHLETYNRAHVNSLCFLHNGDMLVSLGCIMSTSMSLLRSTKMYLEKIGIWPHIVAANSALRNWFQLKKHEHTELVVVLGTYKYAIVRIHPDKTCFVSLVVSGTTVPNHNLCVLTDGSVLFNDTSNGEIVRFNPNDGSILSRIEVDKGFLRGIVGLSDKHVAVGSQHTLFVVDIVEGHIVQKIRLSDDPRVSIYGIEKLPVGTAPLPARLTE